MLNDNFKSLEKKPLRELVLNNYNKKYVRNFMMRMIDFIDQTSESKFPELINSKDPYEIEHILPDHFEWFEKDFADADDFANTRHNIGDLLLLPKSVNSSLKDLKYENKLPSYTCGSKGNVLSASLGQEFLNHNPKVRRFARDNELDFFPAEKFGKKEVARRARLYEQLASLIWNTDAFADTDEKLPETGTSSAE